MIISYMITRYMHVHLLLYSYTLIGSSDSLNLHIQVYVYYLSNQVFGEDHMCYEEAGVFSAWLSIFFLFFVNVIPFNSYTWLTTYFIFLFICYHVLLFICYIAVLSYHHSDYIACSGYFRLSVYSWGIFLTYIRHRLSSRLRFTYFGKRGGQSFFGFRARFDFWFSK